MSQPVNDDGSSIAPVPLLALLVVVVGVLGRVLPHPANAAPIAAAALFGANYLPKRLAIVLPLVALLLSDAVIGFYHLGTMLSVYGSFALVAVIGLWVRTRRSPVTVLGAALLGSLLFFLITNAAVWLDPMSGYAPGLSGLLASYAAGLPFFRGTVVGDLVYTSAFFGAYELARVAAHRYLPERIATVLV